MAESILDQALAMIPGVGRKGSRRKPSREQQLASVQKSLAKLVRDVQSLAAMIEAPKAAKKASGKAARGRKAGTKAPAGRSARKTKAR